MGLYSAIERRFFNSLTRKIVGNVVFLLLPHLAMVLLGIHYVGQVRLAIGELGLETSPLRVILDDFSFYALVTVAFALVAGIGTIFFMRHLFLRPIRAITGVLHGIKDRGGDISVTLPAYTYDEIFKEQYYIKTGSRWGQVILHFPAFIPDESFKKPTDTPISAI